MDGTERPIQFGHTGARSLGFLFFHPVLLRTFRRNLKLRVGCLEDSSEPIPAQAVREAMADVIEYLDGENQHFFTYRIGAENAAAMRAAFGTIYAATSAPGTHHLRFAAERRWCMRGGPQDRLERLPGDS